MICGHCDERLLLRERDEATVRYQRAEAQLAERTRERDEWTQRASERNSQAKANADALTRTMKERDEARAAFGETFQKLADKELELTRALLDLSQLRAEPDEQIADYLEQRAASLYVPFSELSHARQEALRQAAADIRSGAFRGGKS